MIILTDKDIVGPDKNDISQKAESLRLKYASQMLQPQMLSRHFLETALLDNWNIPDVVEWSKDPFMKTTVVHLSGLNSPPIDRYFKTQKELEAGFRKLNKVFRKFDPEKDRLIADLKPDEHSNLMVSIDEGIVVGSKIGEDGKFSVYVYPGKNLKREILDIAVDDIASELAKSNQKSYVLRDKLEQLENQKKALNSVL